MGLQRYDGDVFVQLGKWVGGHATPFIRLPGVQVDFGESVSESVQRLINGKLEPLAPGIQVGQPVRSVEQKYSQSGVFTEYITTTFSATYDMSFGEFVMPTAQSLLGAPSDSAF